MSGFQLRELFLEDFSHDFVGWDGGGRFSFPRSNVSTFMFTENLYTSLRGDTSSPLYVWGGSLSWKANSLTRSPVDPTTLFRGTGLSTFVLHKGRQGLGSSPQSSSSTAPKKKPERSRTSTEGTYTDTGVDKSIPVVSISWSRWEYRSTLWHHTVFHIQIRTRIQGLYVEGFGSLKGLIIP